MLDFSWVYASCGESQDEGKMCLRRAYFQGQQGYQTTGMILPREGSIHLITLDHCHLNSRPERQPGRVP